LGRDIKKRGIIMKKVYVLAYYDEDPDDCRHDDKLYIAGVFDSKEACEASKRGEDMMFETTYFEEKPTPQSPPWTLKDIDWSYRPSITSDTHT